MRGELQNPYWAEVQTFPNSDLRWNRNKFEPDAYPGILNGKYDEARTRKTLVKKYAWSIPTDVEIWWLADQVKGRRLVEIGAGTGYWASLLYQAGVNVLAYDKAPPHADPSNPYFDDDAPSYFPVMVGDGPEVAARHGDDVLFLCWPNYGETFAHDTLAAYGGDTFIFKGEGDGGCTGDDDFFRLLERDWTQTGFCDDTVQWGGIHDFLYVYKRSTVIHEQS